MLRHVWIVLALMIAVTARAQTPYGAVFPDGAIHDRYTGLTNLTTPYAAEHLGRLVGELDVPIGGQRLGTSILVIDAPPGIPHSAEAGPRGSVLFYRGYLEKLTGVKIDPARPGTVNAAVRAIENNPRRADAMRAIVAHELGHLTQGHGRYSPGTAYESRAQVALQAIKAKLYRPFFQIRLDETNRRWREAEQRAGRPAPAQPSVSSHVDEYSADQHAVLTNYLARRDLRGALDFWNKVSGNAPAVQSSHPTKVARILNAAGFVEAHPEIFAGALEEPLSIRVLRELPPLTLARDGDRIRVTGRDALVERLAPPERLVFERYQSSRASYYRKTTSRMQRALYPEHARYPRTEREVVAAFAPSAPRAGARAAASLRYDVARGGIFVGPALALVTGIAQRVASGQSAGDAWRGAGQAVWSVDAVFDAAAGSLGAAAGAALVVPAAIGSLRLVGGVARTMPALAGAMVAARLAGNALALSRQGKLDAPALFGSIDWAALGAQVLGTAIGMNLAGAAISAGLLPALALGPVALVPLATGIAGGVLAERLLAWWRARGAAPPAPALESAPASPSPTRTAVPHDETDPFADLPRR